MPVFIASNGIAVRDHKSEINVNGSWFSAAEAQALHEYLQGTAPAIAPKPWTLANPGDLWLLTEKRGNTRPWTRLDNGEWGSIQGCRQQILTSEHFVTGNALWAG